MSMFQTSGNTPPSILRHVEDTTDCLSCYYQGVPTLMQLIIVDGGHFILQLGIAKQKLPVYSYKLERLQGRRP